MVAKAHRNADKILVEKVIRALYLLELLQQSKLDFVLKGGTALMLLLKEPKRLSIDIDIILQHRVDDMEARFEKIVEATDFVEFSEDVRQTISNIDKAHYKFYYRPVTSARSEKEYILLDILYDAHSYGQHLQNTSISSPFIKYTGESVLLKLPTYEAILGDKLTAFAPNTTGVQFGRGKEIEIIKQLYDIGILFDFVEDTAAISEVFGRTAQTELTYRNKNTKSSEVVMEDILQTSLCIATRGQEGIGNFEELQRGIQNIRNFIFSEPFHLDRAMIPAAKAGYLSAILKSKTGTIEKYSDSIDMTDWEIDQLTSRLNKFKRTNPEVFFYWYQASLL